MMKRFVIIGLLASPAAAQAPNPAATRVVVPAPPSAPAQTVPAPAASIAVPVPVTPQASVPSDPATEKKARYVGEVPPVELTLVYPPAEGQAFALETYNLVKGQDGYYSPTVEANSFVMKIPEPWKDVPVLVICSVKGKPRAIGSLFWQYSNDAPGGGVDFRFPPGETETRYQTNFAGGGYPFPMKSMWLTLPMATGVKECRVSGTFVRPAAVTN
jgi:hypothetical protein